MARLSAAKAERELNRTIRPIAYSLLDTAESLIRFGLVAAPRPARAAA
ncbi:hypothetical protein ACWDUL_32280 [Nocardia niigatensis]|nr:hypothetical protein [Nocardia niigatensis]